MQLPLIKNPIQLGDFKKLARDLTLVENDLAGSEDLLKELRTSDTPVIGITGPP
ncbi:MAG: methylmalonyl Co-A mutase-associated GTPase MeaB, partial [Bacteroidetes bacterium]|nr:methylmalonyl Co-A mutase-associated GTPase MeaB [Bacteroidota bacterium]